MTLDKGEEKSLRIGFETKGSVDVEKTYRLFLRELPVVKPGEKALKVALRLAVPVFISPKKKETKLAMGGVGVAEGKVVVTVKNSGNSHGLVEKITVAGTDETGAAVFKKETSGWYVLAGSRKTFSVDIFEEECRKTRSIRVTAKPEGLGAMEATASVDGANCEKAPERSGTKRPDEEKGD
jgi:fimbrial chaperone protein